MQRHSLQPRPDWRAKVEAIGLTYHSHHNGPYWDESACYELTDEEVATLEQAGNTLHRLCIDAAEAVIQNSWWDQLGIPQRAVPSILRSWERDDFSLYGRFDLAYDGRTPPKLLEYNADTPTTLLEASVAQWFWLQEYAPAEDQFNSIHERLIDAWKRCAPKSVHFSSIKDNPEDEQTVTYLRDTCQQAGIPTRWVYIEDMGWDRRNQWFVDLDCEKISHCFKLYPWEWLWEEDFSVHLESDSIQFLEPTWKMILSNKGLLPVLWKLFPDHPNLLPAFTDPAPLNGRFVRKPRLSREGSNVTWVEEGHVLEETKGEYGSDGYIFQALGPIPEYSRQHPVCGIWIIDHEAAGLGIREDTSRITGNLSRFVPHFFRNHSTPV